jgi:hypothetical protein
VSAYFLGVDLGQSHDFSTIAVVERAELGKEWDAALFAYRKATELRLRMLERIPLGTPYPEVTARVAEVTHARALAAGTRHLPVDATGVGRPVVDLLRRARPAATLMPVVVTPGERQSLVGTPITCRIGTSSPGWWCCFSRDCCRSRGDCRTQRLWWRSCGRCRRRRRGRGGSSGGRGGRGRTIAAERRLRAPR